MKGYVQVREDLADLAAVQAACDANPGSYAKGTIIFAADGSVNCVVANDGTTVTLANMIYTV